MDLTFPNCKKAEIPDPESGRVIKADVAPGASDSLLLTVPRACKFPLGEPLTLSLLDPVHGVVTCRCELLPSAVNGGRDQRVYRCEVLECLSQEQRREDIKISLNVKVLVTLARSRATALATLRNISASGVYLVTELAALEGDQLTFQFTEAGAPIPLTAEVLRTEKRPDLGSPLFQGYGCRFVRLSPHYEAQLRSYIFKSRKKW